MAIKYPHVKRAEKYEREEWTSSKEKDLIQYLGRFGMTPSDRSKISIPEPRGSFPADRSTGAGNRRI